MQEVLGDYPSQFSCITLLNKQATARNVRERFKDLFYEADPDAVIIFYFAGHAVTESGSTFLITLEAEDDFEAGVDLHRLNRIVHENLLPNQTCVFLLDCCHAGALEIEGIKVSIDDIQDSIISASRGVTLIAAADHDAEAFENDEHEHGVFTYYLSLGLGGDAANSSGEVTTSSLQEYLAKSVSQLHPTQRIVYKTTLVGKPPALAAGFSPQTEIGISRLTDAKRQEIYLQIKGSLSVLDDYLESYHEDVWSHKIFRETSVTLTGVIRWREELVRSHPDLRTDQQFGNYERDITRILVKLADIRIGTETPYGAVVSEIGSGGFGTVYEVSYVGGREAYKVFHSNQLHEKDKVKAFRRGYHAMEKLDHPNIVKVSRDTIAPLGFYMQYINGQNFRNWWTDDLPLLMHILNIIAQTLEHAHSRGVIHRDIKPENIVIAEDSPGNLVPYLTDFDLAWYSMATTYSTMGNIATFGHYLYAAPEQYERPGSEITRKATADIYGFGQLCHFAICGKDPVTDATNSAEDLKSRLNSWASAEAANLFLEMYKKCIKRAPSERYQTMDEVSAVLFQVRNLLLDPDRLKVLTKQQFMDELLFSIFGLNVPEGSHERFDSLSGRTSIIVRNINEKRIEIGFSAIQGFSNVGGSFEEQRNTISKRIDETLAEIEGKSDFQYSRQKEPISDVYDTRISIQGHNVLTLTGVESTRTAIKNIIRCMEV